jgi:hypothetical protein
MLVASTERHEALHNCVEVVVRQVVEHDTYLWWWLLELKAVAVDGLDGSRYQF